MSQRKVTNIRRTYAPNTTRIRAVNPIVIVPPVQAGGFPYTLPFVLGATNTNNAIPYSIPLTLS